MKRLVCMFSKEKAEILEEMGFSYMIQEMAGKTTYVFVESKYLTIALQDKKTFGKKDYFYNNNNRLTF